MDGLIHETRKRHLKVWKPVSKRDAKGKIKKIGIVATKEECNAKSTIQGEGKGPGEKGLIPPERGW